MNTGIYLRYIIILLLFISFVGSPDIFHSQVRAEHISESEIRVLEKAEYFFTSLRDKKFEIVWSLLSTKSQEEIIDEIIKSSEKMGGSLKREAIQRDFEKKGSIFINYWSAFVANINTNMILNDSLWEIGYVKKNKAQLIITFKKSKNPAKLMMYKENRDWRVGLFETFRTQKYLY